MALRMSDVPWEIPSHSAWSDALKCIIHLRENETGVACFTP